MIQQQIAAALGIAPSAVHSALVFAVLTAICGFILTKYLRIVVLGAIATVVILAFLKSPPAVQTPAVPQNLSSAPQSASDTIPGFSKEKSDFVQSCVAEGENTAKQCVDLWYEKQYEGQGDTASTAVAPVEASDTN